MLLAASVDLLLKGSAVAKGGYSGPFAFANRKSDQKGLEKGPSVAHARGCL